jgi:hypothetical protein
MGRKKERERGRKEEKGFYLHFKRGFYLTNTKKDISEATLYHKISNSIYILHTYICRCTNISHMGITIMST